MNVEKINIVNKLLTFLNATEDEGGRWVTIKGQKVMIDEDGNILGGNPKVTGGHTKIERKKEKSPDTSDKSESGTSQPTKGADSLPELKKEVAKVEDKGEKKGDFEVKRETKKALLLKDGDKEFWIQKRWMREDGSLTKAGETARKEAKTPEQQKEEFKKEKAEEKAKSAEGHSFDKKAAAWESDKAYGFDVTVAWTSSLAKKVRVFIPKSQIQDNGNISSWIMDKKLQELHETLPAGFFVEHSGGLSGLGGIDEMYKDKENSKDPVYTIKDGKLLEVDEDEKQNAVSKFPEFYYVRHMQAGLCGYEDETILVDNDAIAALGKTFNGKPVYIEHQDVDLQSMKQEAVGYVTDTWVDGTDGWLWSKIMVTDDEGHEVINKGWAVSNAYIPTQWGEGGMKHNLPYDRKVLNGEFTHLALVPNPRYEDAKIYTPDQYQARNTQLMNSLAPKTEEKKGIIMKFFKTKKEEVSNASDADTLEYVNAKGETVEVSVSEMVSALENAQKQERTVKVNGKEMKVSDVVKAYEALNAKKNKRNEDKEEEKDNEDDEDEKENEHDDVSREDFVNEDDDMENESDEDEKENEDDEDEKSNKSKKNSKDHFKTLTNASRGGKYSPIVLDTTAAKLARGAKYGS